MSEVRRSSEPLQFLFLNVGHFIDHLMLLVFALLAGTTFVFWRAPIAGVVLAGVRRRGR